MATLIPLDTETTGYREWLVTLGTTEYCIVQEETEWTLLRKDARTGLWQDDPYPVDQFLTTYDLLLAEGE